MMAYDGIRRFVFSRYVGMGLILVGPLMEQQHQVDSYKKNITRYKFITENYQNIISKYDFKNMVLNVRKYKNMLESIAIRFARSKNNFYSKLSELKPTIMRKKELTSINDFVTQNPNKEVSPKKIEIYFIDGKISISYKITEHQHY